MALTVTTYHSIMLRVIRPNRITSALCSGDFFNCSLLHSTAVYQNLTKSCKHGDYQAVSKSLSDSNVNINTQLITPLERSCDSLELRSQKLACDSQKIICSSRRHVKQSAMLVPCGFHHKYYSARDASSSYSLLEQSVSFYHQSTASHISCQGWLHTVNALSCHRLLRQQGMFHTSQIKVSSFSPTRLILESSPPSFQPYLRLIRFDKPIGSWLLYWPCTWSIALAAQPGCLPDLRILALFGAGAFFMRGAGCIINDMWDKDFDAKVARTRMRPLAAGEITQFQALVFLGTQLSCALAILLQLNTYSIILGAASMGLVVTYPLFKRFTYWPQLILGLTLNWGVLLAWSSLMGSVELPGLILYLTCTLHTVIYDTIYSHQDKYDDMLIGIKSTAILLGDQTKPWLSVFTAVMTGGMTFSGYLCDMTWPYYLVVGLSGTKLAHQIYSVNLNNADHCAQAFRENFYLGAVVFTGIVLANLLRSKTEDGEQLTATGDKDRMTSV